MQPDDTQKEPQQQICIDQSVKPNKTKRTADAGVRAGQQGGLDGDGPDVGGPATVRPKTSGLQPVGGAPGRKPLVADALDNVK